ncbi:peptide ABC transporter permease [candidate division KSB3 bacterium]|uniref:Peptide ABC transporter permease n=1 Tax=candidate division KSB3 bacterium TaxID=2044937 RepID=A0A2G6E7Z8_9BACT|nr:MAG: peptide ABC transporter permease [candidate division KSB3 bacterium]PIE30144.1 MAG: peptide ABC transporter permease [candidate division KSB3 bacterium]
MSFSRRTQRYAVIILCLSVLAGLFVTNALFSDTGVQTHLALRKLPPSSEHWLGTDWLGRDMLIRTVQGLCLSLKIGVFAAGISVLISVLLGLCSATLGPWADSVATSAIDLVMSMPHLVLLILLSFTMGGGGKGVIIAVALSHWPRPARIIRAEVLQLLQADYVRLSQRLGRTPLWIARHHMLPHVFPQILISAILLFPHAILHAAGLTFLGFGLSPNHPSIGILLSESMRHLSTGYWWLAVFPGAALVCTVKIFDILGNTIKALIDPKTQQD